MNNEHFFFKRINNATVVESGAVMRLSADMFAVFFFLAGLSVNSQTTLVGDTAPHSEGPRLVSDSREKKTSNTLTHTQTAATLVRMSHHIEAELRGDDKHG